jgi:hypothetical protein
VEHVALEGNDPKGAVRVETLERLRFTKTVGLSEISCNFGATIRSVRTNGGDRCPEDCA